MDISKIKAEALKEFETERNSKAKKALKTKYREQNDAKQILDNINREIEDLEASISDGTYFSEND